MIKRVWVLSELYYPEQTSTGYFLTEIAESLAKKYDVSVICSQPTYSSRGRMEPRIEHRNRTVIYRCWSTTLNKDVIFLRLINFFTISVSIFINTIFKIKRHDAVIVVTNPPLLPFLTLIACRLRGAKCLLLVHDVYPESAVKAGILKAGSLTEKIIRWVTSLLLKNVDKIIVLGRDMARVVADKIGRHDEQIVIIPNWADCEEIIPLNGHINPLLLELGVSEKFIVQYSGNMGRTHGIEYLVESAEQLKEVKDLHFLFIGWGAKRRWLEDEIKKRRLTNVTLLGNRRREDLGISLNACKISVISFVPGMAGISVPSRMYNILAAGKPILAIADQDSELAEVVSEENIGWVVSSGKIAEIVKAVLEAKNNPKMLAEMGSRARKAAEEKYSFKIVAESYHQLISKIT
jgi:colanic acid biosynthesis glycosyl transferase WcaI